MRDQSLQALEVVVVDSAPRVADARAIAGGFGARYLREDRPGLSRARNRGAREAQGEIVVFLDDDVTIDAHCLAALAAEFHDPRTAAVSGRVMLAGGDAEARAAFESFGGFDPGPARRTLDLETAGWFELANFGSLGTGAMLAVRRSAFDRWPGFDERLGRGGPLDGSEELHAFFSLVEAGDRVVYTPLALARHPAPESMAELRRRVLNDAASAAAYMTLLFVEYPRYRSRVVRYAREALRGTQRAWRPRPAIARRTVVPRWRERLAWAIGPVRYARMRLAALFAPSPARADRGSDHGDTQLRQRLVRQGILNNSSAVVTLLIGLVMVPVMLAGLGSQLYGAWIMIVSLNGLVMSMDFGLGLIVTREVARSGHSGGEEGSTVARAAGGALLMVGMYGLIAMLCIGLAVRGLPFLGPGARELGLAVFALAGAALFAEQVVQFSIAVLAARMRFGLANGITAAGAVLRAVLVATAIVLSTGLTGVAAAYATGAAITAWAAALVLVRTDPRHALGTVTFDWRVLRPQLRFGLSSLLATLAGAILWQVHPILIGSLLGAPAVTVFFVGMRLPLLVSEMNWRTAEVLFPAASAAAGREGDGRTATALSAGLRWLSFLVMPMAVIAVVLAPAILDLWLRNVPAGSTGILRIGVLVMLLDAWAVAALQVLWGLGKATRIALMMGMAAAIAVLLDLFLLPVLGQVAAPLAMIAGLAVVSGAALQQAARYSGTTVPRLFLKDVVVFLPAAASCAAATMLGAWVGGEGNHLAQALLGSLLGIAAYVTVVVFAASTSAERELLRQMWASLAGTQGGPMRWLRTRARGVAPLRSGWYLLLVLGRRLRYRASSTAKTLNRLFEQSPDPWNYDSPAEQGRYRIAEQFIAGIQDSRAVERVLEIACAEGAFTERLAGHCRSLLSVDFSSAALERARRRRDWGESVRFAKFDLGRDAIEGRFTLIVVMDVLTYFQSVRELKAIRARIVDAVEPGGWLLVGDVRQSEVFEASWWGRWLLCGGLRICEFIAEHAQLTLEGQAQTGTHVFRLFRKAT